MGNSPPVARQHYNLQTMSQEMRVLKLRRHELKMSHLLPLVLFYIKKREATARDGAAQNTRAVV